MKLCHNAKVAKDRHTLEEQRQRHQSASSRPGRPQTEEGTKESHRTVATDDTKIPYRSSRHYGAAQDHTEEVRVPAWISPGPLHLRVPFLTLKSTLFCSCCTIHIATHSRSHNDNVRPSEGAAIHLARSTHLVQAKSATPPSQMVALATHTIS